MDWSLNLSHDLSFLYWQNSNKYSEKPNKMDSFNVRGLEFLETYFWGQICFELIGVLNLRLKLLLLVISLLEYNILSDVHLLVFILLVK